MRSIYADFLDKFDPKNLPESEDLIHAYFDYHVTRQLNLFLMSGSNDEASLCTLLTTISRLAFKIADMQLQAIKALQHFGDFAGSRVIAKMVRVGVQSTKHGLERDTAGSRNVKKDQLALWRCRGHRLCH